MNTDEHRSEIDLLGKNSRTIFKEETGRILACAFAVINELGPGLHEKCYERALTVEMKFAGIPFCQQPRFKVVYKGAVVGEFIPDLIVDQKVVVDTKVIQEITDSERGQLLNYLRLSKLRVGLILNFRRSKLAWERIQL